MLESGTCTATPASRPALVSSHTRMIIKPQEACAGRSMQIAFVRAVGSQQKQKQMHLLLFVRAV
jgi:hypothetical protein